MKPLDASDERHPNGASGNQRDLNDVDGRENYLLLLITGPRYKPNKRRQEPP